MSWRVFGAIRARLYVDSCVFLRAFAFVESAPVTRETCDLGPISLARPAGFEPATPGLEGRVSCWHTQR